MALNLTCEPGPESAAGFLWVGSTPALVMYLDPGNVAVQLPEGAEGGAVLVKFCRELAREAAKLADELEADGG